MVDDIGEMVEEIKVKVKFEILSCLIFQLFSAMFTDILNKFHCCPLPQVQERPSDADIVKYVTDRCKL